MAYATYVCQLGCMAECKHELACIVFRMDREHPHPTERGRDHHFGYDPGANEMHEWNGAAGKCRIYTPEDDDA